VAVRFVDRTGRLTQVVKVALLVRDIGQGPGYRFADRVLAVRNHSGDGYRQSVTHLGQQSRQIGDGGRQQTLGQQDLAGQAVTQHPQDLVADVGLQAIDGQHYPTLLA
jgi:hypothetical protein